eukprot:m.223967 g.223967  ORF g.223967 m.223967 type:complete len:571 (-) comp33417_c1_seq3:52-1764(-)
MASSSNRKFLELMKGRSRSPLSPRKDKGKRKRIDQISPPKSVSNTSAQALKIDVRCKCDGGQRRAVLIKYAKKGVVVAKYECSDFSNRGCNFQKSQTQAELDNTVAVAESSSSKPTVLATTTANLNSKKESLLILPPSTTLSTTTHGQVIVDANFSSNTKQVTDVGTLPQSSGESDSKMSTSTPTTAEREVLRTGNGAVFACTQKARMDEQRDLLVPEENQIVIDALETLRNSYDSRMGVDFFRLKMTSRALSVIKGLRRGISTYSHKELKTMHGLGDKTIAKIFEISNTGTLERNEIHMSNPTAKLKLELELVWGVGVSTAERFINEGLTSIEELREPERFASLTTMQKIGVELHDDFRKRIPRAEVELLGDVVKAAANAIAPGQITVHVVGSYRRGSPTSGDIDCMFSHVNDEHLHRDWRRTIDSLLKSGFITHDAGRLNSFVEEAKDPDEKFMGACKLQLPGYDYHRRIDIFAVRQEHMACSLLQYTGDDYLNRSMRCLARKKNMSLSLYELSENVVRDAKGERVHDGDIVPLKTEREVFEYLGLDYLEPEERNHGWHSSNSTRKKK